jgi:NitT/TauT family transport system substrate-binding protein
VADHSLVMPALAAGEIDLTSATTSAGLFNAMAKGTPIKLFMERAREAPGMGSNAILVNNELYARGFTNLDGYRLAKGQKIGMAARGSVAQYMHVTALERVGLTANDVDWQWGMAPSVSTQLLATNKIGLANLALPGAYAAAKKGVGKIVAWSDEIKPNFVLVLMVVNEKFLAAHYSAVVRFGMAMLQANREYNAAARNGNPEILEIISKATGLPASVIDETRPRWALMSEDGLPDLASIMEQQRFWHERTDLLVKTVPEDQMFTLKAIKEARARLDERNPFV